MAIFRTARLVQRVKPFFKKTVKSFRKFRKKKLGTATRRAAFGRSLQRKAARFGRSVKTGARSGVSAFRRA